VAVAEVAAAMAAAVLLHVELLVPLLRQNVECRIH
jgi:hypothetical protein